MKRDISTSISILFLVLSCSLHAQLSPTENYTYTKVCLNDDCTKKSETVVYTDGVGRTKQAIQIKGSPSQKDVVSHFEYNSLGKQTKSYLSIPQGGTQNGGIYAPLSNATAVYGSEKIYAETVFEESPVGKPKQVFQVGNDWATHPKTFNYDVNIAGEVKKFKDSTTWIEGRTESSLLTLGTYAEGQLLKNTETDEDGNTSISFTNGKGQKLLIRRMLSTTEKADTYYVYNIYGQMVYMIPPLAAAKTTLTPDDYQKLIYQYRYDAKGRQVEKKLPGKGWEYMVYDKQDRLIMTRDSNMESQGQWFFTKYDMLGRVVYSGITAGGARSTVQTAVNTYVGNASNNEMRSTSSFTNSGMTVYYSNSAYPVTIVKLLSVNYYDTYPTGTPTIPASILNQAVLPQDPQNNAVSTKSLPTASYVKNIEDDNWTKAYTWYDMKGRPIGAHSINHLGGYTKTEMQLDFAGLLKQSKTYHKRLNNDAEKVITEDFEYNGQNMLLAHKHQVDNNTVEILSENTYNELSQLISKKIGNNLQSIDYTYNIRGWKTKINDPSLLGTDLFAYKIKYNQVEGLENPNTDYMDLKVKPRYNGSIAEVDWKTLTNPNDNNRRYGYVYDSLSRLKAGFYQSDANPSAKEYGEILHYDVNGNILNLKRSADLSASGIANNIDNLIYIYSGNRITSVTDISTNYNGYPDTSGSTITYDSNGNMKNHLDKGILQIDYNFLNQPNYIKFNQSVPSRGGDIYVNTTYLYRADGDKLRKVYTYKDGANPFMATKETEYLDGFQYESLTSISTPTALPQIKFIPTAEGYYNFENNKYIYSYADHLGNTRLSYFRNGSSAEVLEENNYYPFGLKHEAYNDLAGNEAYQYKYNGKELQAETGMYDYGWRHYMPDIGRWTGMDMLTEEYQSNTPYAYVLNNPVMLTDPDGRKVIPTEPLVNGLFEGGALWDNMTGGSRFNEFMEEFWSGESKPLGGGGGGDEEEEEDRGVDNNGQGLTNTPLINSFNSTIAKILGLDLSMGSDDCEGEDCPKKKSITFNQLKNVVEVIYDFIKDHGVAEAGASARNGKYLDLKIKNALGFTIGAYNENNYISPFSGSDRTEQTTKYAVGISYGLSINYTYDVYSKEQKLAVGGYTFAVEFDNKGVFVGWNPGVSVGLGIGGELTYKLGLNFTYSELGNWLK